MKIKTEYSDFFFFHSIDKVIDCKLIIVTDNSIIYCIGIEKNNNNPYEIHIRAVCYEIHTLSILLICSLFAFVFERRAINRFYSCLRCLFSMKLGLICKQWHIIRSKLPVFLLSSSLHSTLFFF